MDVCGFKPLSCESDEEFVTRLCRYAILLPDDRWNAIDDDVKAWINRVVACSNLGVPVPFPPGCGRGKFSSFVIADDDELFLHVAVLVVVKNLRDVDDVMARLPGKFDREKVRRFVDMVVTVLDVVADRRSFEAAMS